MDFETKMNSDRYGNTLFNVLLKDGDEVVKKTLTLDKFIELITDGREVYRDILLNTTDVPKGAYKIACSENPAVFSAVFFMPEEIGGSMVLMQPLSYIQPRRVVYVSNRIGHNGGSLLEVDIFAVKDTVLTDDTRLYWYPLGHVDSDGHSCFGNVPHSVTSIMDVPSIVELFFMGDNSGHYFIKGKTVKVKYSFGQMMEKLSTRKTFPYNWLMPAQYTTVKELWAYKLKNA